MCRLLVVKNNEEFSVAEHLKKFAQISKDSKEFQGHGWGCSYLKNGEWQHYKNIKPVWEDNLEQFGRTTLFVAHARSAFRDENIVIENNMPFYDNKHVFIFNGELQGVKIKEEGRIGAEKVFNYIKRFNKGDMFTALCKAIEIIEKKTNYVKAMNTIIVDKEHIYVGSIFNEDPDYFMMQYKKNGQEVVICSQSYPEEGWKKIENGSVMIV